MHDDATKASTPRRSPLARLPLYVQIVIALVLGVIAGELLPAAWAAKLDIPARMLLQFLGAVAPPLILIAVMRALITAKVRGRLAGKMFFLLALNTLVAIFIGILVANALKPGTHGNESAATQPGEQYHLSGADLVSQLLTNIPASLLRPLVDNNVIGVIIIAVAFGLAARRLDQTRRAKVVDALGIGFDLI